MLNGFVWLTIVKNVQGLVNKIINFRDYKIRGSSGLAE
jgi:hypothetical protein